MQVNIWEPFGHVVLDHRFSALSGPEFLQQKWLALRAGSWRGRGASLSSQSLLGIGLMEWLLIQLLLLSAKPDF